MTMELARQADKGVYTHDLPKAASEGRNLPNGQWNAAFVENVSVT